MSWRDRLRAAQYRGVRFYVDSHEFEGGVRAVAHTYPQRQEPLVEWLGRRVRKYRIDGYLIGEDYPQQLQRLVERFEKPPSGFPTRVGTTLIHPYLGALRVVGESIRVRETKLEGRMAKVEMQFLEAGREPGPPVTTGQQLGLAIQAKSAAETAATAQLVEELEVVGVVEELRQAVAGAIASAGELLESLDVFTGPAAEVAALGFQVKELISQAAGLATAPATLAATVLRTFDGIVAAVENASGALTAYEALLGIEPEHDDTGGPVAAQANANAVRTTDFLRAAAAGGAVQAAVQVPWESLDDALAAQGRITAEIDDLLARAGDQLYPALQDVRAVAGNGVPAPGQDLPSVVRITLPGSVPALQLASRLYDSATREAEIVARNRIAHPLFVPGSTALQVLSG